MYISSDASSCDFEGTSDELSVHQAQCKIEGLKGFIIGTNDCFKSLQEESKVNDDIITNLKSTLASLSGRVDQLGKSVSDKIGEYV